MNYTFNELEFPLGPQHKALWSTYWCKPQYYHYQVRLPVRYATSLEEFKDPINHYQLDVTFLPYYMRLLPVLNAWCQQEKDKTYDHWQCHLVCYKPIDTQLVRRVMYPEAMYKVNIYCRVARDPWDSVRYATKERSRVLGPYFYTAPLIEPKTVTCSKCQDKGCLVCSGLLLNAL